LSEQKDLEKNLLAARKAVFNEGMRAGDFEDALKNIITFNWSGSGPSGCDNHCIDHPCGLCRFDISSLNGYINKVLRKHRSLT
jgi:hypothetical protein